MKISFHGAARNVTGSKHLITLNNNQKILLDCGLFQGMGPETDDLNAEFGFDPKEVDALILSHAHIDHSGLIPKLVKEGFNGPVYCTSATRDLTEILLMDSAEIQTYEIEFINKRRLAKDLPPVEPLYSKEDVTESLKLFQCIEYDNWFEVIKDTEGMFTNAGHLIGSASIHLVVNEGSTKTRITFSGDVGRSRSVLLPPASEFPQADYIILESTYGDKLHELASSNIESLAHWIRKTCMERGGKLVIPAFSVGRTQEVLYALNQLHLEKRLPELNYFVDSPLSMKATGILKKYTEQFNERLQQVLKIDEDPFDFPGLKFVETVEDSKRLAEYKKPCVIISASGTADAGRVRHHIFSCIDEPEHTILMVGYCEAKSLGGQLIAKAEEVEIFGDVLKVAAEVGQLKSMSAHADADDLCNYLSCQDPESVRKIFLVHGEFETQKEFSAKLERRNFKNVEIPSRHAYYEL